MTTGEDGWVEIGTVAVVKYLDESGETRYVLQETDDIHEVEQLGMLAWGAGVIEWGLLGEDDDDEG